MVEYVGFIRDASQARVAEVDDFTLLDLTLKLNDVGVWTLIVPVGTRAAAALAFGAGFLLERDGTVIFSGPVGRLERRWSANQDVLEASGPDDTGLLATRLASPQPAGPAGAYATNAYDVRTGVAETVLHAYVNVNAGAGALTPRIIPGLTAAANLGRGSTITGRARFDNLLEFLQGLATAGSVNFRVIQVGTAVQFQVYVTTDKSATVIFDTELGTLRGFAYSQAAAEANFVTVGGGGEGTARTFIEGGDQPSITTYGRREQFRDRRDTTDTTELTQARDAELAARKDRKELRIEPVDTDAQQYLRDYTLGDRVSVVADGVTISDVLREVRIRLSPEGAATVTPAIGTPNLGVGQAETLFRNVRAQDTRLRALERR